MTVRRKVASGLLGGLLLWTGWCTAADGPYLWPDPAFRFAGRDFSRAEAVQLAAASGAPPPDSPAAAREAVRNQRVLVGGIVLCERSGIRLSEALTAAELGGELLLLPPAARRALELRLRNEKLTPEWWMRRESRRLDRQFSEAARRWYRRQYTAAEISEAQIQDWYFRNQDRFLELKMDPEQIWVFDSGAPEAPRQALAELRQGRPGAEVRRRLARPMASAAIIAALNRTETELERLGDDFVLYRTADFQLLARAGAVQPGYRPLDGALKLAIGNALYDALAKARLAAALRAELADAEFEFY